MRFVPEVEVSEQLGLPTSTLPSLRRSKKGPKWYRFGNKAHYLQEDVDSWLATCVQDPNADADEADEVEEGDGGE